ncbi:MAG TPA: phosphoglucosamine mutase [Ignavibacteria bacterium]|mgnify:CR=1 FL=1|nr:phosphoglucosamine mutase [Ignavibacteria bacterium]HAX50057.1 phosphoglucosamine mutase [Bacteroidota bacterium]HRE10061.1 phosphoglucosamine mutase [Ignavibacteria bacterium]HRF67151.1 phosphoglucosamine mutase [Ignavibacteria bacterium]HRJ03194.1 phosphoglucosamine mutase [Ignavibacteria bacterium]
MKEPIISISGIRGIFGVSLTPENIVKYAAAFAKYSNRKKIVIGRDGRMGGELVEKLIETTLLFCGCPVVNIGIAPTPTISLAVETLKAAGGIAVTASHNPQEWNGMKFINSKGIFLDAAENARLWKYFDNSSDFFVSADKIKQIEYYPGFLDFHISKVLNISSLNLKKIKSRKFKVVVDCVNASGSKIIPELLERLGCRVIKIDCDPSGIFTRKPEPLPENLKRTCREVKKNKADIGIVIDPDADRLVIITEKGEPFGEENTITAVVRNVLSKVKQAKRIAAINLSTSRSVDDVVSSLSGKLYKSPVGEINVIKKMKAVKAVVGGEGSGGVILPEVHYGRDSLVGTAVILNEIAEFGGKVSEYKASLPQYFIRKSKIQLENIDADSIFRFLKKKYSGCKQNFDDGLRLDMDCGWANFRKSNTEPIIRIITEAKSIKEAEEMQKRFNREIADFLK